MATVERWGEKTWSEVAEIPLDRLLAILPVGAVEAHGPHLPLVTDGIIAAAMAEEASVRLARRGWRPMVMPPLEYSAAPFAAAFAGTVSVRPETVTALLADLGTTLVGRIRLVAIANAHLDPAHLASLHRGAEEMRRAGLSVAFPDLTRKPWALRLGEEFRSGACHAGRFEGSAVLAVRPELVREEVSRKLEPNPASLSDAIRSGKRDFAEAGGPRAYFGDPAAATPDEGRARIEELGAILEEAVLEELDAA